MTAAGQQRSGHRDQATRHRRRVFVSPWMRRSNDTMQDASAQYYRKI